MSTKNDWIATAEEHWGEVWGTGQPEVIRLGLMASRTAATIALADDTARLARETARLADAQERVATAAEALALFRAGDELMTTPATEVQARDMYRAGVALITGDAR